MRKIILQLIRLSVFAVCLANAALSFAQPQEQTVKIIVTPDHSNWQYDTGEKVIFTISVFQFGNPLDGVNVRYEIKPEKMEVVKSGTVSLKNGAATLAGGTMKTPGLLRC